MPANPFGHELFFSPKKNGTFKWVPSTFVHLQQTLEEIRKRKASTKADPTNEPHHSKIARGDESPGATLVYENQVVA